MKWSTFSQHPTAAKTDHRIRMFRLNAPQISPEQLANIRRNLLGSQGRIFRLSPGRAGGQRVDGSLGNPSGVCKSLSSSLKSPLISLSFLQSLCSIQFSRATLTTGDSATPENNQVQRKRDAEEKFGGRFGYFLFFPPRESKAPGGREGDFLQKIPGGGGLPGGWGEGARGREIWGVQIFFFGAEIPTKEQRLFFSRQAPWCYPMNCRDVAVFQ